MFVGFLAIVMFSHIFFCY
jgi:predicted RNase H-like nuclease (RuvC/YqgF family)